MRVGLRRISLICALVVTLTPGCRSGPPDAARESGVARDGTVALSDRLQGTVDEHLASHTVPGAGVSIIENGELVEVSSGVADVDAAVPVTTSTPFRVASVTKMYISAVALRLVERGELSLDDPIARQGIELPTPLSFAEGFTLRQLLSHTSGLGQTFVRDEDRGTPLTHIEQIERMPPPKCPPSECWSYADANYVLTEVALEAKTGKSLAELIRDELTTPLDLNETEVLDPTVVDTPPQYALVYDGSNRPVEPHRLFRQTFPLFPTLVTTASDAARFVDALFGGDVLDPSTLDEMLDTGAMRDLPCPEGCPFEYGLGVFHFGVAGHDLVGHDGGSGAVVVHDAGRNLSLAILTNGGDQNMKAFLEVVLAALR